MNVPRFFDYLISVSSDIVRFPVYASAFGISPERPFHTIILYVYSPAGTDEISISAVSVPFADAKESMIAQIKKNDILLSYPYESMKPFFRLLREAANDEAVVSIYDDRLKIQVLEMFNIMMNDNVKARHQLSDASYIKLPSENEPINAQEYFYAEAYRNAEQ